MEVAAKRLWLLLLSLLLCLPVFLPASSFPVVSSVESVSARPRLRLAGTGRERKAGPRLDNCAAAAAQWSSGADAPGVARSAAGARAVQRAVGGGGGRGDMRRRRECGRGDRDSGREEKAGQSRAGDCEAEPHTKEKRLQRHQYHTQTHARHTHVCTLR